MASDVPPPPPPPPPPPAPSAPKAAYVEEYNEEAQASRPETRQSANISTKRSKPDFAHGRAGRDEYSDSGYSSHTAATPNSSAPSSLESKTGSNTRKIEQNTTANKRKPIGVEKAAKSRPRSPEKPALHKTPSKAKKDVVTETSKGHQSKPKAKSKPLLNKIFGSSKPSPAPIIKDTSKAIPVRPRTPLSQPVYQPRPISYYGGAIPVHPHPLLVEQQQAFPPAPVFPQHSYPPPLQSYFPPPQHILPPQDIYAPPLSSYTPQPRSSSHQLGFEQQPARRPRSVHYGSPPESMVQYGEGPVYIPSSSRQSQPRERVHSSLEDYTARPEDYYREPSAPRKSTPAPNTESRPPIIRHAHTTSDAHSSLRRHHTGNEEGTRTHASNRSPDKQSFAEHERSRRPPVRAVRISDESIPSTRSAERAIESNAGKQRRRASVYGPESLHDLEGTVEAYQATQGTPIASRSNPVDALVHKKKPVGSSSDTSSRHSGKSGRSRRSREGSDVRSRRPSSDVKSRNDKDGIAMRFNASQGVNIQMKGGIEGRTISLRQSRDGEGEMEFGIGSRGRTVGSRPPIIGREKNRRSFSYIEGRGVTEVERPKTSSRPPRTSSYRDERGLAELERMKTTSSAAESIKEEHEPRIVRERITTTTRSRSRRSSRSGYSGWGRAD